MRTMKASYFPLETVISIPLTTSSPTSSIILLLDVQEGEKNRYHCVLSRFTLFFVSLMLVILSRGNNTSSNRFFACCCFCHLTRALMWRSEIFHLLVNAINGVNISVRKHSTSLESAFTWILRNAMTSASMPRYQQTSEAFLCFRRSMFV